MSSHSKYSPRRQTVMLPVSHGKPRSTHCRHRAHCWHLHPESALPASLPPLTTCTSAATCVTRRVSAPTCMCTDEDPHQPSPVAPLVLRAELTVNCARHHRTTTERLDQRNADNFSRRHVSFSPHPFHASPELPASATAGHCPWFGESAKLYGSATVGHYLIQRLYLV